MFYAYVLVPKCDLNISDCPSK